MNRREISLAVLALDLWPAALLAQQSGRVWRVAYLLSTNAPTATIPVSGFIGAFPAAMRELGYVEGKNLVIDWIYAAHGVERSALALELTRLKTDVVVAAGTAATRAAQAATSTLPIVMGGTNDPVGSGFVQSLALPGGNTTGLSLQADDLGPKQTELLLDSVPKLSRMAVMLTPANLTTGSILKEIELTAQKLNVSVHPIPVRSPTDLAYGFSTMAALRVQAAIIAPDGLFNRHLGQIAELALKHGIPSIYSGDQYAAVGGLMSFGPDRHASYRRAAAYVDRIFKGAKPAELPVEQPTTFELVINLKTAKALGLKLPQSMMVRAGRFIE